MVDAFTYFDKKYEIFRVIEKSMYEYATNSRVFDVYVCVFTFCAPRLVGIVLLHCKDAYLTFMDDI